MIARFSVTGGVAHEIAQVLESPLSVYIFPHSIQRQEYDCPLILSTPTWIWTDPGWISPCKCTLCITTTFTYLLFLTSSLIVSLLYILKGKSMYTKFGLATRIGTKPPASCTVWFDSSSDFNGRPAGLTCGKNKWARVRVNCKHVSRSITQPFKDAYSIYFWIVTRVRTWCLGPVFRNAHVVRTWTFVIEKKKK